ncbi:MAG: glycosyltransferase family 4 protein [Candidatus Bathyarchaeia archaeon]
MRVVMVNGTYGGISGSGRAVKILSTELIRSGFEVYLCTTETVGYVNIPKLKTLSFAVLGKLKSRFECDVAHVHNPKLSVVAKRKFPNILTIHGDYILEYSLMRGESFSRIFDLWFRGQTRKFRVLTCVSPYWSKLRGWRYVPNGLNLEEVREIPPAKDRYVLFVGRKDLIKGYDLFEKAMSGLPYPYKMLGIHERVPWERVIAHMKSAYCLVLPSIQEGMPYAVLEAWASGCPVIATNLPTLRSFGYGAIYFLKERNVRYIRQAVSHVIADENVAEELRRKGLERVKAFDIKNVVREYIKIYEESMKD